MKEKELNTILELEDMAYQFDELLEEKNIIQNHSDTYFYITVGANPIRYRVAVNIKEKDRMQEIIDEMKADKKEQIKAWNEKQRKRQEK